MLMSTSIFVSRLNKANEFLQNNVYTIGPIFLYLLSFTYDKNSEFSFCVKN